MYIVGLTGGIGSGKTTVSRFFFNYGIAVYCADKIAKLLINTSEEIKISIEETFGKSIYKNGVLNKKRLSRIVFKNTSKLQQLNQIIHPEVKKDFALWCFRQKGPYVIKEAAILFETGTYNNCNAIISVVAPLHLRINRIMERDGVRKSQVMDRVNNQKNEQFKINRSDFVIYNDTNTIDDLKEQVSCIHKELLERSKNYLR